jgi:hypothetical protein
MLVIHSTNKENRGYKRRPTLLPVSLALLVMALSLVTIAVVYLSYGHLTGYASKTMELQQKRLRRQYGLSTANIVTNPKILEIPPSMRDMPSEYYNNPL